MATEGNELTQGQEKRPGSSMSNRSFQLEGRNKKEKQLDRLARLLTGSETCVGVCLHENRLFIASNNKNPDYACEYIKKLRDFVIDPSSKEKHEELLNFSVKCICLTRTRSKSGANDNEKILKEFLRIARDYKDKKSSGRKPSWESLPKVANELFAETKGLKEDSADQNKRWKYLTPWHDTNKIVKKIVKGKLNEEIIEAIKKNFIWYIVGYTKNSEGEKKTLHAEMKIIEEIFKIREIYDDYFGWEMADEDNISRRYIGLTKLSCDDCYAVVKSLEIGLLNGKGFEWKVCGRHGSQDYYTDSWLAPNFVVGQEQKIQEWKNKNPAEGGKLAETTSEIPYYLAQIEVSLLNH